jgi:hypothetical protein
MSETGDRIQKILANWKGGPLDPDHEKALDKVTELKGDANIKAAAMTKLKNDNPNPTADQMVMIAMAQSESDQAETELTKAEAELKKFPKE